MEDIRNWQVSNLQDTNLKDYIMNVHELLCHHIAWFNIEDTYFTSHTYEQLQLDNRALYASLLHYETSYANPDYASNMLPEPYAKICCSYYYEVCQLVPAIFQKRKEVVQKTIDKFYVIVAILQDAAPVSAIESFEIQHAKNMMQDEIHQLYVSHNFMTQLHSQMDFEDMRYLFRYGIYISPQEEAFAQMMNTYADDEIHALAKQMVDGFQKGFEVRNKKASDRTCARVVQIVGLEKIAHAILNILEEKNHTGMIGELVYQGIHPQIVYDHRQDDALYYSEDYAKAVLNAYEDALASYQKDMQNYQGNIIMVAFGQDKFDAKHKSHQISYQDEQNTLWKQVDMGKKPILENYVPKAEVSFTGMAYPVHAIHPDYERIFQHIMQINQMDPTRHEEMQELLIAALDQGKYVEIIGQNGNDTHMQIYLQELKDASKQTNFVNCGADINIPVGEVYTSPQLKHSSGVLHIRQARISKIAFQDIRIQFQDGKVTSYSCQNTDDEKANHDLMEDVIFHHCATLPIGEFAIGTNTYAYMKAKADGILYKLHTLIFEKLGPHIAIGDTCFAWSEENELVSLFSGKEMIAKDNEVSCLRTKDVSKAYMGVHYDLTIPYEDIASIVVHTPQGTQIPLIMHGRFVLAGCEDLNIPLDEECYEKNKE